MARPAKTEPVNLLLPANLTAGVIERLTCPPGKTQVFLRDAIVPGLRVRVSNTGAKSFVVERKSGEKTVRKSIGDVRVLTIEAARTEARRLLVLISQGNLLLAQKPQAVVAIETIAEPPAVRATWDAYLTDRKDKWGARHYDDHVNLAKGGGLARKLGGGKTQPGVLHGVLVGNLDALTPAAIEAWATREGKVRATQARLGARMLGAFLNWCGEQPELASFVQAGAVKTRRTREALGKAKTKKDALLREQLATWFAATRTMGTPAVSAYLQVLLLTGARPSEVRLLRWADIDWAWRGLCNSTQRRNNLCLSLSVNKC